jgi:SAM-dependent methyltransferase
MADPTSRRAMAALYAGQGWPADGDELLQRSLAPRSPDMLLEAPGWLGLGAGQLVLDAGCRDGRYAMALTQRYHCRVVGVDLVLTGQPKGGAFDATTGAAERVALVQGDIEALPVASGVVDLVWCRDTLSCLDDCARALRECARLLRPGGGMVLYAVFTGDRLEPGDRALVVEGLGNSAASMHEPTVEAAIASAGFAIVRRERIGTEWSEHRLEQNPDYLTKDLLEVARLTRDRDRLEAALGPVWYQRALAFDLWRLQIALGRLVPILYALVKRDAAVADVEPATDPLTPEELPNAQEREEGASSDGESGDNA